MSEPQSGSADDKTPDATPDRDAAPKHRQPEKPKRLKGMLKRRKDTVASETEPSTPDDASDTVEDTEIAGETAEDTAEDTVEGTDTASAEDTAVATAAQDNEPASQRRQINWQRVVAFGVLPAVLLLLAAGAGFLKWQTTSIRHSEAAAEESVQAATDSAAAILSYEPDTVEQQLTDARDLLTGEFRESYTKLTNDVVIPGAQQQQISADATVPAAASVSAGPDHAVVLVFVNQTVIIGGNAPSDTASSVRVVLEKVDDKWLISEFDPV